MPPDPPSIGRLRGSHMSLETWKPPSSNPGSATVYSTQTTHYVYMLTLSYTAHAHFNLFYTIFSHQVSQ